MVAPLFQTVTSAFPGAKVIPLHSPADTPTRCDCRKPACDSPAKHPRTPNGFKDASNDPVQLERWWRTWTAANVAVVTGKEAGFVGLDVDPRHGGDESLRSLEALYGALPETVRVLTGGGGTHYLFKHPGGAVASKADAFGDAYPGLDIRGDGGYLVAPPSLHVSGKRYEFEAGASPQDVPLADMPGWMLKALSPAANGAGGVYVVTESAADLLLRDLPEGQRHDGLLKVVGLLASQFHDEGLVLELARSVNQTHVRPPLPEAEIERMVRDISRKEAGKNPAQPATETVETAWPAPLQPEAFYGLAGGFVRAASLVTEADPVATLAHLLAAFGSAVGSTPHMRVMHDKHPARLFAVLVGDSAKGRKGSSWSEPRTVFEAAAPDWTKRLRYGGLSSGEGIVWAVRDPRIERQAIKERGRVVDYEDVCVDQGEPDKRLFVIEEEFANLLAVMKREGNTVSPVVRQAWDHGNLSPLTKNARISATDAHISIIGHVTRDELRARIEDVSMVNGFANRFLWFATKRARLQPLGGGLPPAAVTEFGGEIKEALDFAARQDVLRFDSEAEELWVALYESLSEGQPGLVGAALARAEPQVLRLALTYALLDASPVVRAPHLLAATAVWDYAEASTRWVFGTLTGDPVTDTIITALRNAGPAGIDGTGLHALFGRHQPGARIQQVLDGLIARGLVLPRQEETGGRPRQTFVWTGGAR
jgi:hypothetical protein